MYAQLLKQPPCDHLGGVREGLERIHLIPGRSRAVVQPSLSVGTGSVRVRTVYPDATFRLVEGEDSPGFDLDAYTDAEDAFAVLDLGSN